MARQQTECLIESVGGEGGAWCARFFAPDFLAIEFEDGFGVVAQERDFFLVEAVREKQITEFFELPDFCGAERHGAVPRAFPTLRFPSRLFEAALGCGNFSAKPASLLRAAELRFALGMEGFDPLAE